MIHIVGAGSGAVDLITVRGQRLLSEVDVVIYAGFLVSRELLDWVRQDARIYDSATMGLEQVLEVMEQAERDGLITVRLHIGGPCLCDIIRGQMDSLDARGVGYDICPGVSSFYGAAAALGMEYTLSGTSQSVVITRMAGRISVPDRESIGKSAAHGSTMVIFLSAGMTGKLPEELMKGGYPGDTPAAIVYKVNWSDEKVVRCTVTALKETVDREGIYKTVPIAAGNTVAQTGYGRSKLYDLASITGFRVGREDARGRHKPGTLYVVGMGPGEKKQMTGQALEMMEQYQVIAGYTIYVEPVRGLFPHKEFLTTAMTREEERCRKALDCCMEGRNIAMTCSGDAGVYGMVGLMLELTEQYLGVSVRTVPGITATCAEAAVLGAPLMHDLAVTSLSDRLAPLEVIWNRVEAAARADFVICLHNPASKGRPGYFRQACSRILRYRPGHTVCGLAVNIGREGEGMEVLALEDLKECRVDIFTTVYIGNPHIRQIGPHMAIPRGHRYEGN